VLAHVLADAGLRRRAALGALAGAGFLGPGLFWMSEFSAPGFVLAVLLETGLFTLGAMAVPPGRLRAVAFPAALLLAEALRGVWPFGGVPIATLAETQVGGPLAPIVRVGGVLLLAGAVAATGAGLAALARRRWAPAAILLAAVVALAAGAQVAPDGHPTGTLDIAAVQGGGPRGTRAVDTPDAPVFERHVAASADVPVGLDLVLWPEDVVDVEGDVAGAPEGDELVRLADRLDTTLVVGVVEGAGDRFRNRSVAYDGDGELVDSYTKNQRVPFGEYIPFRSLVEKVADVSAVPRDATVGSEPGLLATPAGDLGVVISYEVFFPRRARAAVNAGGEVLLVPTNASSFSTTQMPALELAAARLRALETGRYVVQAAPTGFSAVIDADGRTLQRTDLGEPAVLRAEIERRAGRTLFSRLGDLPVVLLAAAVLAGCWLRSRRGS
jgi:apolipoprotein N-acyltransferase